MTGQIHDWHNLRGECPQNDPERLEEDCTCEAPTKRARHTTFLNRAKVRASLLEETNARNAKLFTQVYPSTLDEIEAMVKREILRRADNPPRKGKTI